MNNFLHDWLSKIKQVIDNTNCPYNIGFGSVYLCSSGIHPYTALCVVGRNLMTTINFSIIIIQCYFSLFNIFPLSPDSVKLKDFIAFQMDLSIFLSVFQLENGTIMSKAIAFGTVWPLSNAFFLYRQTPVLVKRTELIMFYLVTITTGMIMAHNKMFTAVVEESTRSGHQIRL
jgi:hypothetical protein